MNTPRSMYHVHAELVRTGHASVEFDDAQAGYPMERRLNRMERVAASFRGRIDARFSNGMLMTFDSADAALLGACEMQHRCAGLPQVAGQRLALRIGMAQGFIRQRLKDDNDSAKETAVQLCLVDDGIVLSSTLVDALNSELRKLTTILANAPGETLAFEAHWRSEIPSIAFGSESRWPASPAETGKDGNSPYLRLYFGPKSIELTADNPTATLGRDPANDLVLVDDHVSRYHCRIERTTDAIILTDLSTNGTTVMQDDDSEFVVKKACYRISGKGLLFCGRQFNGDRRGGVRFEAG